MDDQPKRCFDHSGMCERVDAVCRKMDEREKLVNAKFDGIFESIRTAKLEMDRRLEGMNEFRAQLSAQATQFISREQVELLISRVELKIDNMKARIDTHQGGAKWEDHIITVLIGLATVLVVYFITKK